MPTSPGDPEAPSSRPQVGWWGGVWRRLAPAKPLARAARDDRPAHEGAYSREAVQAMIERKRRNDALRRREFDLLRQVLRQQAAAMPAPVSPAPIFHSSIPCTADERATTLRKINEIEAQMSVVPRTAPEPPQPHPAQAGTDFVHDPEFEEAALRFASGDTAGAEAVLRAMLDPAHPRASQAETWRYLFDLYRACGQSGPYDDLGAEFARRLQCSPPQWRAAEATLIPQAAEATRTFPASVQGETAFDWVCPAVLEAADVAGLQEVLAGQPQPWRLSWAGLTRLEPGAVAPLALLVAHWARSPIRLRLAGAQALERVLDARTACGERGVDPAWWALRLDWLRATRRPAEFELVALDYCVTYEVSPPSWDPPVCDLRLLETDDPGQPRQPVTALEPRVSVQASGSDSGAFGCSLPATPSTGELTATLAGDAAAALARLDACAQGADRIVVSCERLVRIDFEAAGALSNWVAARQREGCAVHLVQVHRLVAALLAAVGLASQARITLRRD